MTLRIILSVFLTAGVMAQEEEAVSSTLPAEAYIRGDMVPQTPKAPGRRKEKYSLTLLIKDDGFILISDQF